MQNSPVRRVPGGSQIHVWVVPGSSRTSIEGEHGDKLKLRVSAPPEGGKATREAAKVVESAVGAPVTLVRGMTGRHKVFEVAEQDTDLVRRKLGLRP